MRTFLDTSVLVAAMVEAHSRHERARPWLERARKGEFAWVVSAHSIAELYAVLTTLPVKPMILPGTARRLIDENLGSSAQVVALTAREYLETIRRAADRGLRGGIVYDALHARAASKSRVRRLVTCNPDHFRRAWPEGEGLIVSP